MSVFNFEQAEFIYDPYPLGVIRQVLSAYDNLSATWPENVFFERNPGLGMKYSLADRDNPGVRRFRDPQKHFISYREHLTSHKEWSDLHAEIKSREFRRMILSFLAQHGIELPMNSSATKSRWEFSMMPADGGHILPHTDGPEKIVTLVICMHPVNYWMDTWGGWTEMLKPIDPRNNFNFLNRQLSFSDVETLHRMPLEPNHCIVFVKTFNSLHCVRPMTGPKNIWRRTLTINLERIKK